MSDLIEAKDISGIPYGGYCYTPIGWEGDKYKIKLCPYWKHTDYGTVRCEFLGIDSLDPTKDGREDRELAYKHFGSKEAAWDSCGDDLLWDQIKACDVHCEEENYG